VRTSVERSTCRLIRAEEYRIPPPPHLQLAEIAWTRVLARDLLPDGIVVSAVCPGYCSTAMSSFRGDRSAAKGAETPAWLVARELVGPVAALSGRFWLDKREIEW
jgi:NAD(P)-dependent dehydrogenase (short-subunit alcohol dehydrogenase family)